MAHPWPLLRPTLLNPSSRSASASASLSSFSRVVVRQGGACMCGRVSPWSGVSPGRGSGTGRRAGRPGGASVPARPCPADGQTSRPDRTRPDAAFSFMLCACSSVRVRAGLGQVGSLRMSASQSDRLGCSLIFPTGWDWTLDVSSGGGGGGTEEKEKKEHRERGRSGGEL